MNIKYGIGLWLFGELRDRFTTYHPPKDLKGKFEEASKVKGADGIEVIYPAEFGDEQLEEFIHLLKKYNLKVAGLIVDLFAQPKWVNGSLTSRDEKLRKEAIDISCKAMDIAKRIECNTVSLWLGQDGYDYPFQADYIQSWDLLVKSIREIAEYRSDIKIALEYKLKEPRTHIFIGTVGKAIMLAEEVGLKNVGVTLDVGHAIYGYENPSESLIHLNRHGKLFHVHFNDNYRFWDDDMIVGSVNFWETLELFYWLRKIDYNGWISLDIYPYREDVVKACEMSIKNLQLMDKLIDIIGMDNIENCIKKGNIIETFTTLKRIFKES
ncbi:MAG: sugar phosphate isomerase/epimerase family protein [Candidatus Methanomethylicaceae archaeon]